MILADCHVDVALFEVAVGILGSMGSIGSAIAPGLFNNTQLADMLLPQDL